MKKETKMRLESLELKTGEKIKMHIRACMWTEIKDN